jgi:hypothetical protein
MKTAIEAARRQEKRTSELATEAHHAREQHDLYEEKTHGPGMTSFGKLRELEQARDLAETRLQRAQQARAPEEPHAEPDPPDIGPPLD